MLEEKREIESHHVRCLKTRSTPTIEKLEIVLGVEASQESTPTPLPSRQHLDSSTSTYLRLTHQQLDKSTSTYFRLIINVFISRRRLILHSDECSTTKVPGYALDVDLFRLIRLINRSQVDLSTLDDRQMPTQGKEGFPTVQSWGRYQYMILVVISINL